MLYHAYEARRRLGTPLHGMAALSVHAFRRLPEPLPTARSLRPARAAAETLHALRITHERPNFHIDSIKMGDEEVPVREERVASTPFATLLRFTKETDVDQPPVLLVPGLAGHFATLIKGTVKTMLPDHDVYVADWHNARDVPAKAGPFGLDEYIDHLIEFMVKIGPGGHIVAICQPCVATLAAASIMAQDNDPAQPRSVTLMAGPVDARINPGPVNAFAERRSPAQLEQFITRVPWPHAGRGRRVYPGFLQVAGFMSLDPKRHFSAFAGLFADVIKGSNAFERTKTFYAEYFAVLDIAAEFYLDTARAVFQEHHLADGRLDWHGRRVDPGSIRTALMTVEGEKDELCPPGQTHAAHALCTGIPEDRKRHHLQEGVGHYGVFSGSRFEREIYPRLRSFITENAQEHQQQQGALEPPALVAAVV
jgi:poly(3-hydroxybutyrate) depolymerase